MLIFAWLLSELITVIMTSMHFLPFVYDVNTGSNDRKINILEKIQIVRAAQSADILNAVINARTNPFAGYYHQLTIRFRVIMANLKR
jgi:hypothetical protein